MATIDWSGELQVQVDEPHSPIMVGIPVSGLTRRWVRAFYESSKTDGRPEVAIPQEHEDGRALVEVRAPLDRGPESLQDLLDRSFN